MSALPLTADQDKANKAFLDFLTSDENFFVIQGAAGTGKSFLIKHLLETFYSDYQAYCLFLQETPKLFDIKITATTNKAVSVVEDFLEDMLKSRTDIEVRTIFSLLGLKVKNNHKTGKTELEYDKRAVVSFSFDKTPLVFIDEASFIGEDLDGIIHTSLKEQANAKIVYIGDQFQLTPPGQTYSAMTTLKCNKVALDEVVRNDGHILATGTQFRRTVETGIFQPILFNNTDVIHVDGPEFQRLVEASFADPLWTPAKSKVLAWTNKTVQGYNAHIRGALGKPEMFTVGETVVTNEFIKGNKHYSQSVDSEVQITNIDADVTEHYGVKGHMVELDCSYVGFMPNSFADVKQLLKQIAAKAKDDKSLWPKYFEIKENWLDLRPVYASTINKAQGSTYDKVFLNLTDIGKNWDADGVARLMYVGITRAAKQVICYGQLPSKYC